MSSMIIAIDGPAGSGKSSVAKGVATRMGFRYLDTGAMYRAVTAQALSTGTDLGDAQALAAIAAGVPIEVSHIRH
jgi:CMP/dCMP kinase